MQASLSISPSAPTPFLERTTLRLPVKSSTPDNPSHHNASVESMDLLRGQKAVEIRHNGAIYRLQATKLGKLILTK